MWLWSPRREKNKIKTKTTPSPMSYHTGDPNISLIFFLDLWLFNNMLILEESLCSCHSVCSVAYLCQCLIKQDTSCLLQSVQGGNKLCWLRNWLKSNHSLWMAMSWFGPVFFDWSQRAGSQQCIKVKLLVKRTQAWYNAFVSHSVTKKGNNACNPNL